MKQITLAGTEGQTILVRVDDECSCAVCKKQIEDHEFNKCVMAGDAGFAVLAHAEHFANPGSPEYEKNLRLFAESMVMQGGMME